MDVTVPDLLQESSDDPPTVTTSGDALKLTMTGGACTSTVTLLVFTAPTSFVTVSVNFVVDVSGSMTQGAPGTNMTKWDATRQALSQVVQDLPPSVAMGIVYYPNMTPLQHTEPAADPSECVNTGALVDPQLMSDAHRELLQNSLLNVLVNGGTPTHTAYTVGVQALVNAGQRLPGNKYMLLITDGEPTYGVDCVGDGTTREVNAVKGRRKP